MSIVVGNERLMKAEGIDTASCETEIQAFLKSHQSALYVARNQELQGIIAVAHFARPNAKAVIDGLRKDGVSEICLVTGDTDAVAREIADSLGFDEYRAELLPEDKARFIDQLKNRGRQVVMVGDGINDALALSHSNVGIAMGAGGAEAAIEAADIAIVDSELERLITQRQLSRQTIRVINQNYYLAVSTNIVGIILGAAGFLSPVGAGSIHIIHTVGIMLNSSRLLDWKPPEEA